MVDSWILEHFGACFGRLVFAEEFDTPELLVIPAGEDVCSNCPLSSDATVDLTGPRLSSSASPLARSRGARTLSVRLFGARGVLVHCFGELALR